MNQTTKETRRRSYDAVLPKRAARCRLILETLGNRELTASEITEELVAAGRIPYFNRNYVAPRLTELKEIGILTTVGRRTLPKSNTRRRTSSPVRGSTRSSTEEVSSMAAKKRRRKRKKKIEASKKLAYWAASVATLSAASSLLLSAFGRDPVGELTGTIFTACVGYLITYAGKSLGEKISRNRHGLDADGNPLPDPSGDTLNNEEAKG